jgi:nitrite reductase/ring-hydroxylating ferredoxin subunit
MKAQTEWLLVANEQDLPEGGRRAISANSEDVLLLRIEGQIYAIGNRCPHLGCPLTRGRIDGTFIVCPCHDWTFDIHSGELVIAREITLPSYPVKSDGQRIFIQISQSGASNG